MKINPIHLLNHQIIRDLPFGVIVLDMDLAIKDWNSWMDGHTGIARAETQDKPLSALFPDLEERGLLEPIREVFETCQRRTFSYKEVDHFFRFDPSRAPEQATTMMHDVEIRPLFDGEGEVAMVCVIIKDVTDHVFHLVQLENLNNDLETLNDDLIKASQVKTEFLQNTSHELRTPLTAILGFADLLKSGMAETEEEKNEFLGNIDRCAKGLLDLINDILTASQLQAREVEIEAKPFSLHEIVSETHAIMHPVAANKNLEFTLQMEDPSVFIEADYSRLQQVLYNVLGNALKFTEEGWARMRTFAHPEQEGMAVIEVTDSGIGIEPNKLDLVFEQFQQVDQSSSRKFGGTGLGMTISKSLIELMKGRISIASEGLGKGSTVRIVIPLAKD